MSVTAVLVALFLLGTAEVFADNTSSTLLPMLVSRDDLGLANSRLQMGFITVNQLAGLRSAPRCSRPAWPGRS